MFGNFCIFASYSPYATFGVKWLKKIRIFEFFNYKILLQYFLHRLIATWANTGVMCKAYSAFENIRRIDFVASLKVYIPVHF